LLSASAGVLASAFYTNLRYKRIDASLTLNGALAGLVGITAGTGDVSPIGAIIIGLVAGVLLVEAVTFIDRKVKLDDPVGAIAVHGVCGIWGTLAVGLFSTSTGLFYGGGVTQLGVQAIGVLAVTAWTVGSVSLFLYIVTRFTTIRVTKEEEISGLDFAEHGSAAYELRESVFSDNSSAPEFGTGLVHRLNNLGTPAKKVKTN
jgi:Amt family ammonium transporter